MLKGLFKIPSRFFLTAVFVCFFWNAFTFELAYQFEQFNVNEGLPSSEVYEVLQDPEGYIWFGTDHGLVKYNGYEFKVYTVKNGLSTNVIFKLDIDPQGRVCCYGKDRKIHILENDRFIEFKYNDQLEESISTYSNLFDFDFYKGGFVYWSSDQSSNSSVYSEINYNGSVRHIRERGIHLESNVTTCIGIKIENSPLSGIQVRHPLFYNGEIVDSLEIASYSNGSCFANAVRDGEVVYWSLSRKLYQLNTETKEIRELKEFKNEILDLDLDKKGNLFVATRFHGVWKWNPETPSSFECILPNKSVPTVFIDKWDGVWASSIYNGLFYCNDQSNRTFVSNKKPIKFMEVDSVLFVLSDLEELYSFDWRNLTIDNEKIYEKYKSNRVPRDEPSEFLDREIFKMGVFFHKESEKYTWGRGSGDFFSTEEELVGITRSHVYVYSVDFSWDARINIKVDFFLNSGEMLDSSTIILGTATGVILIDRHGYEFSGYDAIVNNKPKNIRNYRPEIPFFENKMRDILNCEDSIRVFASSDNGLLIETNGFQNKWISENDGLICNEIDRVYYKNEQLVAITKKGISVLSRKEGIRNYTVKNGLLSNNVLEVLILGDKLWVATDLGTSIIENKRDSIPNFPIYLTQLDVNLVTEPIHDEVELKFNQDLVDLSFEGLSFAQEGDIVYKYQLKGVDPTWTKTPNRTVRYVNLPYGKFEFWITAQKSDKTWTPAKRLITIKRNAPFWATPLFYILCGFAVIGLIWFVFHLRYRRLKRIQEDKYIMLNMERKTLQAQMHPHFIFNSLTSLQSLILDDKKIESQEYLGKFARLTRLALNHSTRNLIRLEEEINILQHYIDLEKIRYGNNFDSIITNEMGGYDALIAPMLVQPFVENAIKHGLVNTDRERLLEIRFQPINSEMFQCIVTDNGAGRSKAKIESSNKSLGIKLVKERLSILLKMDKEEVVVIKDLFRNGEPSGTRVILLLPLKVKKI